MVTHVRVAIIGGGIVGCSVAYWLARSGCSDVVILEKDELAGGSTWHAAGLCTQVNSSPCMAQLQMDSISLYRDLEELTGQPTGLREVGSLRLASTQPRVDEIYALRSRLRPLGLPFEIVRPARIHDLWPGLNMDGLIVGAHTPTDGYVDPSAVVQALATYARSHGVTIHRQARVRSIRRLASGEWEATTDRATVRSEYLVNAAGMWASELAQLVGVDLPLIPMEHEYVVTGPIPPQGKSGDEPPVLRDPDRSFYARQEGDGLIVGVYEKDGRPWKPGAIPADFGQELLPPDLDRIQPELLGASDRIPALFEAGIKTVYNGPDAYTPDDRPLVGEMPGCRNFFVIAGFSSSGIAAGGGTARVLAHWILNGSPDRNVLEIDIRRFGPYASSLSYLESRGTENYRGHYRLHAPEEESIGARPLKVDPIYDVLASRGAVFGERFGWERPIWFGSPGQTNIEEESFRVGDAFQRIRRECETVRDAVGILDQTSFGKFMISGAGAAGFLETVSATRVPSEGRVNYSLWLNESGGIEADATITRLAADRFYVVVAAAAECHDRDWLESRLPSRGVTIDTVTPEFGVLSITGPSSREVLSRASRDDFSTAAFPFLAAREITIGPVAATALRISFAGELGWELHVPIEFLRTAYETVLAAGTAFGITDVGYRALDSLRMEKGYRLWGFELSPEHTPMEAGLAHLVDLRRPSFIGRQAVAAQGAVGSSTRLATLLVDTVDAHPHLHEAVYIAGAHDPVGSVAAGAFGHRVSAALATAYLPTSVLNDSTARLEVEILGDRRSARIASSCVYDPAHQRQRG